MTQNSNDIAEGAQILTLSEAGKILNASYSTVLRLVSTGELRAYRMRNSWRTSTLACEEYVARRFAEDAMLHSSREVGQ